MTSLCFYFQVHQPYRLRRFTGAEVPAPEVYFDDELNSFVMRRVAERCYLPMNALLLEAIERTDGRFRCSFSISGTALAQFEEWAPDVLDSFRALLATGAVELLCETSQHSLAALADPLEFIAQVETHKSNLERLFGVTPTSFRNTELITDERVAAAVEALGFRTLMAEGADQLLAGRTPTIVYRPRGTNRLALLLRSYSYSDDIAFRFSNPDWPAYPLMADTFARWLDETPRGAPFIGLFMDYETFGEHQNVSTGIFDFMRALPEYVLANPRFDFATPAEVTARHAPAAEMAYPRTFSWADAERDLSAWLGNHMQRAAHDAVYALGPAARAAAQDGRSDLHAAWRRLTTSDHTYYMSTKFTHSSDGDVHEYFSPYDSPHQAFVTAMTVIEDLGARLARRP